MRAAVRGRGRDGPCGTGNGRRRKGNKTITERQINGIIEILFLIEKIVGIIGPRGRGTTTVRRTARRRSLPSGHLRVARLPCRLRVSAVPPRVYRRRPVVCLRFSHYRSRVPSRVSHDPCPVHAVRIHILFAATPLLAPYVICCRRLFPVAARVRWYHDGSPQCYDHRGPSLDRSVTDCTGGNAECIGTSAFLSAVDAGVESFF